jgi:hypothetical protein
VYLYAATLSGAKNSPTPSISSMCGQITCQGPISRFIFALASFAAAMTIGPTPTIQRASIRRPSRTPTVTIATIEVTPDGDITSPERRAS